VTEEPARIGVASAMTDDVAQLQIAVLRSRTVEDRLRIAESLREFAWELKRSTLRRRFPELTESELAHRVRAAFSQ
jgi:hypothetical protein